MSTTLGRTALNGHNGQLLGCLHVPQLSPLHKLTQVALHSQVYTIFPSHWPWLVYPWVNTRPKLASQSPFPEARQMTENQSLSRWLQELLVAMFPSWGWEKLPVCRLEKNNGMRESQILAPIPASDSNLFLKQDCIWPFSSETHS